MFQQNSRGAGATRRKFGTSIDVNSTRNNDAAGKGGKGGAPVEKRTTRSMAASSSDTEAFANPVASSRNQMRDDVVDVSSRRTGDVSARSSSFAVANPTSSSYQHTGQVDNIDDRDRDDPLCATDYVQDMVGNFFR